MQILKPHVSLNVSNIDASLAFYEKAFGVPATKRRPGYAKFDLREPSLNLSMMETPRTGVMAALTRIERPPVCGPNGRGPKRAPFRSKSVRPPVSFSISSTGFRCNASHFGVQVASTDDVKEAKARFESAGLAAFTEEDAACCYAVQDKVWIEDPDGNAWEVFVVKGDAAILCADASSCCAPDGISRKREAASTGCCGPKTTDVR